jgi:hypothetical protein
MYSWEKKGPHQQRCGLSYLTPSSHIIRTGRLLVVYDLLLCALFSIKLRDGFGSPLISSLIVAGDTSLSSGRDKVDCATFLLRLRTKRSYAKLYALHFIIIGMTYNERCNGIRGLFGGRQRQLSIDPLQFLGGK